MKNLCLTALSAAIISVTSSYASADFLDDSSLDLKLRTVYFDVDVEGEEGDWGDIAEGIELNLKSGYAFDILGFDASYYGAIPISTSGKDPYNGYRGQVLGKDKDGYHALGQAYAKIKLGDDDLGLYSQLGLMRGKNGGVLGTSSRSTPSSYMGGLVEFMPAKGWMIHGGYYNGMKQRTQESVDDFVTAGGEKIDNVWQVGYTLEHNGFNGEVFYIESAEYNKQAQGTLGYTFKIDDDLHFKVEGHAGLFSGNGNKWDSLGGGDASYKDDASHFALTGEMGYKAFTGRIIYGYTEADSTTTETKETILDGLVGYNKTVTHRAAMDDRIVSNDYGSSISPISYLGGNFWHDEQKVFQLEAEFDFSYVGMNGFKTKFGYIYGGDINDDSSTTYNGTIAGIPSPWPITIQGNKLESETEYFLELNYAFPEDSKLNGLSFRMMNAWSEEKYQRNTDKSRYLRWYADYNIAVF